MLRILYSCQAIITTGEKATGIVAECFGCLMPAVGEYVEITGQLRFWRMPSTSRAYPLPLERKAEFYRRLFS